MSSHVPSANGALLSLAWGDAPGVMWMKEASALKARVITAMSRALSATSYFQSIVLGRCPRLGLKSALSALNAQGKANLLRRRNNL
jgi:hypothetical protein